MMPGDIVRASIGASLEIRDGEGHLVHQSQDSHTAHEGRIQRTDDGRLWWSPPSPRDLDRGRYLCEVCGDAMTNDVVLAGDSPTGVEMARCAGCADMPPVPKPVPFDDNPVDVAVTMLLESGMDSALLNMEAVHALRAYCEESVGEEEQHG